MSFDLARQDTICALATPAAVAALAVVRVSGADADAVRARVFSPRRGPQRPFVASLGDVRSPDGGVIDEALCTAFPQGRSYTGEASFELSLHGSPLRVRATLDALVAAGCRLAQPGELTLRAVLTGRMDLCAAEAVDDVVHARSDGAARAALRALRGGLRARIEPVREALIDALAEIEARLDFPDDVADEPLGDDLRGVDGETGGVMGGGTGGEIAAALADASAALDDLLATARWGRRLNEGARVVLYGAPNAGKSTLLNALLGEERALVHEEPGTTRDVLEAPFELGGVAVTLVDVAGVRPLEEAGAVERLGIARAQGERARADLVLALVPLTEPDAAGAARALGGDLAVLTKADLLAPPGAERSLPSKEAEEEAPDLVVVSARTGAGLERLRARIEARLLADRVDDEEALLMRERQVEEVRAAREGLEAARQALRDKLAGEVVASELRRAARALDRLLGRDIDVDVLDRIFSRFCIGK
jgi:tRNA modification GTPase